MGLEAEAVAGLAPRKCGLKRCGEHGYQEQTGLIDDH